MKEDVCICCILNFGSFSEPSSSIERGKNFESRQIHQSRKEMVQDVTEPGTTTYGCVHLKESKGTLIYNISSLSLTDEQISVLNIGLSYISLSWANVYDVILDLKLFARNVMLLSTIFLNMQHDMTIKKPSTFVHKLHLLLEVFCNTCEVDIVKTLSTPYTAHFYNLTKAEYAALRQLQDDKSIQIHPADKGGAMVVMDTDFYFNNMMNLLSDVDTYMRI
ncbi:uncharacterized protein LOC122810959 [Protopterus annectens]|uniref:uncharacterized protein LOC122810959 n=1 Tax=Protopterus annectens TaxID=7888 RepID=UPI001CF98E5A|nr:uncharacterized protein LOC122810959 [Protopterus annectens]